MADNTIIQQGSFTSDGTAKTLQIRSDVDWMRVVNYTEAAAANNAHGVEYYWQRGMAQNDGFVYIRPAGSQALGLDTSAHLAVSGFTLVDSSTSPVGNPVALTSVSNAAIPIVATGTTTGLVSGDIVRLTNVTSAQQLGGIDFTIDTIVASTSFRLPFMAQVVAGTTGFYRKISYPPLFYPRRRIISAITAATSAVVTMTVTHGYTVGQLVRLVVPAVYGMTQMDGLLGTVTAVSTVNNTITLNIDSSAFTAFAFPVSATVPFTLAEVVPVGEAASSGYENLLDDATINTGYLGMILGAGITGPAGSNADVIYWTAGKSFSNS